MEMNIRSKWMKRTKVWTVSIFFTPLAPIFFMLPNIYGKIRTLKWKVNSNESFFFGKEMISCHQTFPKREKKKHVNPTRNLMYSLPHENSEPSPLMVSLIAKYFVLLPWVERAQHYCVTSVRKNDILEILDTY